MTRWENQPVQRRAFLTALAAGTAAALSGCVVPGHRATHSDGTKTPDSAPGSPSPSNSPSVSKTPSSTPTRPPQTSTSPSGPHLVPAGPPPAIVTELPGTGQNLALTVDDGTSVEVVDAYLDFVKSSGIRLTFFPNGVYESWTATKAKLRPLVDSGQVQLGNHTWNHPDLTTLGQGGIQDQILRNERFLNSQYGVTAKPFLRPPYGSHNRWVDKVAADLGYSSIVMWYGSLGDSSILTESQVVSLAQQWMTAQRVVIGHANHPAVTHVYPQLLEIIRERKLQMVTLDDVYYGDNGRARTKF